MSFMTHRLPALPLLMLAALCLTGLSASAADLTPPSLQSILDNNNGRAVAANASIIYTLTFNEDMDSNSVSGADFGNAGTAPISIGSISETAPGVFAVPLTPTDVGTLQFKIFADATLTDVSGNALDTASDIVDDSTLAVYEPDYGSPKLIGISPVATNVGSTITLTMPAEAKPGDVLVAHVLNYASGDYGSIFVSNRVWSTLRTGRLAGQTNNRVGVYSRQVTPADSGTFQLGLGYDAPYAAAGIVMAFSNVHMADGLLVNNGPLDVSASAVYSEATATATAGPVSAISTVSSNTLLMMLGVAIGDNPVNWSDWATSSAGSLTELYDVSSSGGIKTISLGAASAEKAAPGTTGTGSANLSSSIQNGSLLLALKPSYNSPLVTALNALDAHITGGAPLSDGQIAAHKQTIFDNRYSIGSSVTALAAAMELVRTYDEELGPLWVARNLPRRSDLTDDIHYTIFTVMQYIVDYAYTPVNVARHSDLMSNFAFGSSANFPGACPPPEDPNQIHTVRIDADYPDSWGRAVFGESSTTPSPKPTGTYLAPGSIATVTVPASLVGRGYTIRVGAHEWDFTDKPQIKRLDRCTVSYPINATSTQVANPLGGGIYITVPQYRSNVGVVSVEIQNAVRSPYFSAKSFHQTTLAEWQNIERNHPAPWADFQSDKVMMQVPTSWIYALEDPVTLMADWDRAADICNDLMGFPRDRGRETIYNQVDLMLRTVAFTPGYPAVNNHYNPDTDYGGYADSYLVRGPQFAPDYEFHELGHAYRFPKFPGETESDVNLLHVPVMQLGFGYSIDEAFRASRGGQYTDYATLDTTAIAWMMCDNFFHGIEMQEGEKQYALKGHAKFVEIARLFGWDRLGDYFYSFNVDEENDTVPSKWDPSIVNILLKRLSNKVGVDIRPLFHFWGVPPVAGVPPNDSASLEDSIQAANLPRSAVVYDTLVRYKSLVPPDNAALQTFALNWWGEQPSIDGFSEERNHARRWDAYDGAMATATADRAQQIIELYFPNGRPSDYGDWRSEWAQTDLVDPEFDLDGDGMSNDDERIWGLDPTNATSRNPIISNGVLSSGSFSYTRRSQALTGLNYTVWTSTNLQDWNEDIGAQQLPGTANPEGVQSVETILTPELLENPSLFIQMRTSE